MAVAVSSDCQAIHFSINMTGSNWKSAMDENAMGRGRDEWVISSWQGRTKKLEGESRALTAG